MKINVVRVSPALETHPLFGARRCCQQCEFWQGVAWAGTFAPVQHVHYEPLDDDLEVITWPEVR
jgi:hypothetical protein